MSGVTFHLIPDKDQLKTRPEFKWLKIKIQNGFQKIKPFEYQTRKSPVSGDWFSDFRLALEKINNFKFNCIEITINNA